MKKKQNVFLLAVKNLDACIACVTLSLCVILVNVNIIMRYILNNPIHGCEEIVTSLFVWTVFIGSAYAHRKHAHLGVDILVNLFHARSREIIKDVMFVIELAILIMITVISAQYCYHLIFNNKGAVKILLTDVLRFPKWWTGIAVPIGMGLSVVYSVIDLLQNKLHILKKSDEGDTVDLSQGGAY